MHTGQTPQSLVHPWLYFLCLIFVSLLPSHRLSESLPAPWGPVRHVLLHRVPLACPSSAPSTDAVNSGPDLRNRRKRSKEGSPPTVGACTPFQRQGRRSCPGGEGREPAVLVSEPGKVKEGNGGSTGKGDDVFKN